MWRAERARLALCVFFVQRKIALPRRATGFIRMKRRFGRLLHSVMARTSRTTPKRKLRCQKSLAALFACNENAFNPEMALQIWGIQVHRVPQLAGNSWICSEIFLALLNAKPTFGPCGLKNQRWFRRDCSGIIAESNRGPRNVTRHSLYGANMMGGW